MRRCAWVNSPAQMAPMIDSSPARQSAAATSASRSAPPSPAQPQDVEAGARPRQPGAPADGAHHEPRQGHRAEQVAPGHPLDQRVPQGRFRDAGHVLSAGQVESGQPVGEVALGAEASGHGDGHRGHAVVARHLLGRGVQDLPQVPVRHDGLGRDLAPAHRLQHPSGGFLVPREVAFDVDGLRPMRRTAADEIARGLGRDRHHVLAGGVPGPELEQAGRRTGPPGCSPSAAGARGARCARPPRGFHPPAWPPTPRNRPLRPWMRKRSPARGRPRAPGRGPGSRPRAPGAWRPRW